MTKKSSKFDWRLAASVVAGFVAVGFIYWQWDAIRQSIEALRGANWAYVVLATATFTLTVFAAAAVIYNLRFIKNVSYKPIITVQTASLFLARITPASVGGIAAMIRLLVTQGHNVVQASTVAGAAAFSTFVGNIIITSIALIFAYDKLDLQDFSVPTFILVISGAAVLVFLGLLMVAKVRKKIINTINEVIGTLKKYKNRKKSLVFAVFFGTMVTLMYGITMLLVAYSLGVELTLFAAIIAVSLGSLGVAVTPLPGGAVGAEVAIAATLVQFGVSTDLALATALVFRFITFWLPLIPGFFASQYSLKKKYL